MRACRALLLCAAAGCGGDEPDVSAAFATPAGLAVAGTNSSKLFIANTDEDTLQVLNVATSLSAIDFVDAPAQFFPLRVSVGPAPTDLAASGDGRWVIVLSSAADTLGVVDADTMVATAEILELGTSDRRADSMIALPATACGEGCVGLVAVSRGGAAASDVLEVEVHSDGTLFAGQSWAVGGSPTQLAVSPDGGTLYVSDAEAPEVIRIDRTTGAITRHDVGAVAGPLAVSNDGSRLVVARPLYRDVLILDEGMTPIDADPLLTPVPRCVGECGGADPACAAAAHPADRALCATSTGLASTGADYGAIYLGEVPARILTFAGTTDATRLSVPCLATGEVRRFDEFAVIANLDGSQMFVGLRRTDDGAEPPELANRGWCDASEPRLSVPDGAFAPLSDYLGPCPDVPGRNRFVCVSQCVGLCAGRCEGGGSAKLPCIDNADCPGGTCRRQSPVNALCSSDADCVGDDSCGTGSCIDDADCCTFDGTTTSCPPAGSCGGAGVAALPGITGQSAVTLTWEAPLARELTRESGGGEVTAEGFVDRSIDMDEFDIRPGDILEILTPPLDTPECVAALAGVTDAPLCSLERRIVDTLTIGDRVGLDVEPALPPECFRSGGAVAYRVRAGEQFLMSSAVIERLSPGQLFAPGATGFNPRLAFAVAPLDLPADPSACVRYDEEGQAISPMPDVLDRDPAEPLSFQVNEAFNLVRAGIVLEGGGERVAGRVPGGMVAVPIGSDQVIFTTYSADDVLFAYIPFDTDPNALLVPERQLEIR